MFRMDTLYRRHHKWVGKTALAPGAERPIAGRSQRLPSEYFQENIYLTFQDDEVALTALDLLNVDRLLWANDHPHSDATWPQLRGHARAVRRARGSRQTLDEIVRD